MGVGARKRLEMRGLLISVVGAVLVAGCLAGDPDAIQDYQDDELREVEISEDVALKACLGKAEGTKVSGKFAAAYDKCFGADYVLEDLAAEAIKDVMASQADKEEYERKVDECAGWSLARKKRSTEEEEQGGVMLIRKIREAQNQSENKPQKGGKKKGGKKGKGKKNGVQKKKGKKAGKGKNKNVGKKKKNG